MTLNTRGFNQKYRDVNLYLRTHDIDIALIQEARKNTDPATMGQDYEIITNTRSNSQTAVATLVKKSLKLKYHVVNHPNNVQHVAFPELGLHVINLHVTSDVTKRTSQYNTIADTIIELQGEIIVGGDWNGYENSAEDKQPTGIPVRGPVRGPAAARQFKLMLAKTGLTDTYRVLHPHAKQYTFQNTITRVRTRLDRLY